jgi:hypothetical protein
MAQQMGQPKLKYTRSDNKFLWVEDWQRAQQLLDEPRETEGVQQLNALQHQVHPAHPKLLGNMHLDYNWTVYQSEFATDVAFVSAQELEVPLERWLRQAWSSYDSVDVLRFLGRTGTINGNSTVEVQSSQHAYFEGKRIKHYVNHHSHNGVISV